MDHQLPQHVKLLEAQPHRFGTAPQAAGGQLQGQVPGQQLLADDLPLAAGEGPYPGQQLPDVKRLGHVVVGPVVQTGDLVGHLIPGGEHQNGGGHMGVAQSAGHLKAVQLGQHHVQNNDVVLSGKAVIQTVRPVVHHIGLIALLGHDLPQGLRQPPLIFNNQNSHL